MMKLCRMCSEYLLSVLFCLFVFVILYRRPIWFCHALFWHVICPNKWIIGNFAFKLIDDFVTLMEEADVVDEILS